MYNSVGNLVWQADLDIYRKVRNLSKGNINDCPFRYQGQYHDAEIDLYYNRFRYYSPESGTYVSQDPIGLIGGNRFYKYVKDVNSRTDVFGLVDPRDIQFTQTSIDEVFRDGKWKDKTIWDAIEETKKLGHLPDGLTLNVLELNDGEIWATLNNRTLYVAQEAGLTEVKVNFKGPEGLNQYKKLVDAYGGGLLDLDEQPTVRCRK